MLLLKWEELKSDARIHVQCSCVHHHFKGPEKIHFHSYYNIICNKISFVFDVERSALYAAWTIWTYPRMVYGWWRMINNSSVVNKFIDMSKCECSMKYEAKIVYDVDSNTQTRILANKALKWSSESIWDTDRAHSKLHIYPYWST